MTIDINQFWNLLSESQLIGVQQVQTLFSEFSADTSVDKTVPVLAKWMVQKKAISRYQAKILLKGHSGPFKYGNYTVVDRFKSGPLKDHFIARHTKTGFPVALQFFEGTETAHLDQWASIETLAERVADIKHPNVVEHYETIVLNEHRFVASHFPSGATLAEKLPRKARMSTKKACGLIAQVAFAVEQFHSAGIVHNAISPRTIWINKSGKAQLRLNPFPDHEFEAVPEDVKNESQFDYRAPECFDADDGTQSGKQNVSPASDVYSLGCTLVRAISGRTPFPDLEFDKLKKQHQTGTPRSLSKLELPSDLESLIQKMLAKDPNERPGPIGKIANLLALHSGQAEQIQSLKVSKSKSRAAYLSSLGEFFPGETRSGVAAPSIETEGEAIVHESAAPQISLAADDEGNSADRLSKIERAAQAANLRRKNRWKMPAAIAACLLGLVGIIAAGAYYADQFTIAKTEDPEAVEPEKKKTETPDTTPEIDPASLANPPAVIQTLIDDDQESLWETPTTGTPIKFSYLPLTPKLLFAIRPKELVSQPEGNLIFQSLGPGFSAKLEKLKTLSGLDLENIEQLIVSLHTNEQFEYEPYFVVQTETPVERERLVQLWNRPSLKSLENGQDIYESSDGTTAYYVLQDFGNNSASNLEIAEPAQDSESKTGDVDGAATQDATSDLPAVVNSKITRFAVGGKALVEQVALSAGASVLSGSLRKIANWTDSDRHVNILFLRTGLFNDEGQKLMGKQLGGFNRELRIMIPDDVRGGLLSLHLDSGNYFEIMLDKNFDLKAPVLKQTMVDELRVRRDALMLFASNIPPNPYWDRVRIRYASMLADLNKNLRWNVENGEVVANCWLPPMAAHNLLAASELVVTFASGSTVAAEPEIAGPKTLAELLATKRDLQVANPPDLNVLMANLKTEIDDDYGKLPFPVNIRLLGNDLEADGITKNQRPGELNLQQKTLAEILTTIMTLANPDKDITGPNDPNCKLIWVVGEDPENPGQKAILITTRAGAAKKSYELPPAFRTE